VVLVSAPDLHASTVRMWSLRHSGFDLSPVPEGAAQTEAAQTAAVQA
jgi:hypothetical protein